MSGSERVSRAANGRFVPAIVGLAEALGKDPVAALAYQQLFYFSSQHEDGYVPMSEVRMAAEIGSTRHAAREALAKLVEDEVVTCRPGSGSKPDSYRVRQDQLRELMPHEATPQPLFVVDPQPQMSGSERVSATLPSRAHANEGRKERSKEGRKEKKYHQTAAEGSYEEAPSQPQAGEEVQELEEVSQALSDALKDTPIGSKANSSGNGGGGPKKTIYPPEVLAIMECFTSTEPQARMGAFWRKPRGEGLNCATTPQAMSQLRQYGTLLLDRKNRDTAATLALAKR